MDLCLGTRKCRTTAFKRKHSHAFKILDQVLSTPHSDREGNDGEEWPSHYVSLISLYKKAKETETIVPKTIASTQNLIVQRLIFDKQPSKHDVVGKEKTSVWAKNTKRGHALVVRGDNTYDASCNEIITKPSTHLSIEDRKKYGVAELLSASNDSKEAFRNVISSFKDNSRKREERIAS